MVILGLGANLGDRLANLRKALHLTKQIPLTTVEQVSPVYLSNALLPEHAPPSWDRPFLNLALRCSTQLNPRELLSHTQKIEAALGRKQEKEHWETRIIDIDILAWDDLVYQDEALIIPHKHLLSRPFALWPLTDVAPLWINPVAGIDQDKTAAEIAERWGSRFVGEDLYHTRQIPQRIDTPQLVGILNITPDSFSDGGIYDNPEAALAQAQNLVLAGAEILDIGAESTAPSSQPVDAHTEWLRLLPVLASIKNNLHGFLLPPKISVDTRHAEVAEKALAYDIDWINDVTGLTQPDMIHLVSKSDVECVMMHHVSIPPRRDQIIPRDQDPVAYLYQWAEQHIARLSEQKVSSEKIILDLGIGFGKTAEQSLELLKNISVFKELGCRLLVGHSRKSFYQLLTAHTAAERDIETLVTSLYLAAQGVDYLRVHNVDICARGFKVEKALK